MYYQVAASLRNIAKVIQDSIEGDKDSFKEHLPALRKIQEVNPQLLSGEDLDSFKRCLEAIAQQCKALVTEDTSSERALSLLTLTEEAKYQSNVVSRRLAEFLIA